MRRYMLVLAALGACALVGVAFLRDMSAARSRVEALAKTFEGSRGAVQYAEVGDGAPVLSIHGAAGGFDQALDMTGALAPRGYRLIAPSRFGYLGSAAPAALTTESQADAYAELLDHLGIDRTNVVAISAGAWSAIQFAARHPERCRALVLLVPADHLPPGAEIRGGALADAMFKSDFVAWTAGKATGVAPGLLSATMLGTDAAVLRAAPEAEKARVREVLEHLLPVSARRRGMQFDIATAADRRSYPLEAIRCPVLAISAEDDLFGTAARARQIAGSVREGRSVIFPTGGHALVGRHDEALAVVDAFLAAHRTD